MLSLRFVAMLMYTPLACGVAIWRPVWGLYMLVAMYYFRPEIWNQPDWFRPVLYLTASVTVGWLLHMKRIRWHPIMTLSVLVVVGSLAGSFTATRSTTVALDGTLVLFKLVWVQFLTLQLVDSMKKVKEFYWANVLGFFWSVKTVFFLGLSGGVGNAVRVDVGVGQAGGANYLAMILVTSLAFFMMKWQNGTRWERRYSIVMLPTYVLCTVFCGSRGGFLSMGVVLLYLIVRSNRKLIGFAGAAIAAIIFLVTLPDEQKARFVSGLSEAGLAEAKKGDFSAYSRLRLWEEAWVMFTERPLFGHGTDNFQLMSAKRVGFGVQGQKYTPGSKVSGFVTHNTYLQVLSEGGLSQAVPFYLLIVVTMLTLRNVRRVRLRGRLRSEAYVYSVSLEGYMIGLLVASTFGNHIKIDFLWWYFGFIATLHLVVSDLRWREHRAAQEEASPEAAFRRSGVGAALPHGAARTY